MAQDKPNIIDHQPASNIRDAVAANKAQVEASHRAAGNSDTSGAGSTIIKGKVKGEGDQK